MGGRIALQKLRRRPNGKVEDLNLTLLVVKEIIKDDGEEENIVEAKNNDNSVDKLKEIGG